MLDKNWVLKNKKGNIEEISKEYGVSMPMAIILNNRGIDDINSFIKIDTSKYHSPKLLKGCEEAVDLIIENLDKKMRVCGDMDVDGITSTEEILIGIRAVGGNIDYDIPHRVNDGYGLNKRMVDEAIKDEIKVIITVDNGIAALEPIKYAKDNGIVVIVTDHHEPTIESDQVILPEADVIVNPKQPGCQYPFKSICGAMVAYKLIELLYEKMDIDKPNLEKVKELASIGTVCDIMDLVDENRTLVQEGLELIKNSNFLGIRKLISINGIDNKKLSTYHIGFIIGPSLNSTGRLDSAKLGVNLLELDDEIKATQIAEEIKELNDQRKEMTNLGVKEAENLIKEKSLLEKKIWILYLPNCHESVAGIIAGRIKERYNHPTIVLTNGANNLKGSARSIEKYDMFAELTKVKGLLDTFGGHTMAAGLSLQKDNLEILDKSLNDNCSLDKKDFIPKIAIDVNLPLNFISEKFIEELNMLEPYGKGNPKPIIAERNISVKRAEIIGKNKNVLKMKVVAEKGMIMDALYFGDIEEFKEYYSKKYGAEEVEKMFMCRDNNIKMLITYNPNINEWNGLKSIQIIINEYK